jgi:hypothetical protein
MHALHRTTALGVVALAAVALFGMSTPEKPASEAAYLRELSRLHATDGARALLYARQGDVWYSNTGTAAEARKAMAITLLVDLGKIDQARRETRAFIAAFPDSPYRPLVQGVTGIHPRPHGPQSTE